MKTMQWNMASSDVVEIYITPHQFLIAGVDPQSNTIQNTKKLKRYLLFLLSQISITHRFSGGSNDRMLIEIYPDQAGGATVYFIVEQKNKKLYQPIIFCFDDSDALIDAATKLISMHGHRILKSDLYKHGHFWLLIIHIIGTNSVAATTLMSEYGLLIADKIETAALIKEHCHPIILNQAVDEIALYFS